MGRILPKAVQALALAMGALFSGAALAQLEEPEYEVLKKEGNFEVRQYRNFIVAEVMVTGDMERASSDGFRLIAAYIFGGNTSVRPGSGALAGANGSEKIAMTAPVTLERMPSASAGASEKIAMTAPVTLEKSGAEAYRVHFVMPAKYTMQTLPKPKNDRVTLREVAGQKMAALRFSGFSTDEKVGQQTASLEGWMVAQGLKATGPAQFARYDPPIVPPFLRRSEMLIPLQ